jgi:hypothetical protein
MRARLDGASVTAELRRLERTVAAAAARALNTAMRQAHKATVDEVLQVKRLPKRSALTRREGKEGPVRWYRATPEKLEARLWVGLKRPLTVRRAGVVTSAPTSPSACSRKRARGGLRCQRRAEKLSAELGRVDWAIKGGGKGASLPFWARMESGHVGVFVRTAGSRLPIAEAYVPIVDAAQAAGARHVERHYRDTYPRELRRLMRI